MNPVTRLTKYCRYTGCRAPFVVGGRAGKWDQKYCSHSHYILDQRLGKSDSRLARKISPNTRDIAWAAGIYEGEGSVNWTRHTVHLTVCQKSTWLLSKLRELFGGNIVYRHDSGCSYWYITGARARGFAMTIYQFLSPRRKSRIVQVLNGKSGKLIPHLEAA